MENMSWTDRVKMKKYYIIMEVRNIVHRIKRGRLIGLDTCFVGTVCYSSLWKERWK